MSEILYADDDPTAREMVAKILRKAGHEVRLVTDGQKALDEVRSTPPDLVLLDYEMGTPDGFEVCRQLKGDPRYAHLPVLILTGQGEIDSRIQGFDAGANDYMGKPVDPRELLARVAAMLRLSSQVLERNPTSKLPGGEAIATEFENWLQRGQPFAVCYLDLDEFKPFGDRFGFSVADAVIRETGDVLRSVSKGSAFVGHVGGDDFILLCEPDLARPVAEEAQVRLRARLTRHLPPEVAYHGSYLGKDREGMMRKLRVTRLSAAIVRIDPANWQSLTHLGEIVAEVKRQAKQPGGIGIEESELVA